MTASPARTLLPIAAAALLGGCASIHSYDAAREINPVRTMSLSGSVGTTFDTRDRDGDRRVDSNADRWKQERVLIPDARLNILIPANDVLSIALDPLPPAVGGGLVAQYRPDVEGLPRITLAPTFAWLVFPAQNVWAVDVPLAFSWKLSPHWVVYAGPKYLYQSRTLHPVDGVAKVFFFGVPKRPDQPLEFQGIFGGVAFGWIHMQLSPEVIYYESRRHDGERILQVGGQIRFSL